MIILLSPAKSLDYDAPLATKKRSQPRMLEQAERLVDIMRTKSPDELSSLMSISPDLAALNVQRFQDFTTPFTARNARQAVLAFTGDVYQGMDPAGRFDARDFTEAQKTVRILSGLYGVLRPLDLMQPYRLEMGTKLATERGDTLYDWWGTAIAEQLAADLSASPGPQVIVNLASNEYFRAVDTAVLGDAPIITPRFLDEGEDGTYRMVSFFAKRARGEMTAWLVTSRARTLKAIREFAGAGYRYDAERSTAAEPTFLRDR